VIRRAWQWAVCAAVAHLARTSVYVDTRDWWVGLYRDPKAGRYYVCPTPCLVVRYQMPGSRNLGTACWCMECEWNDTQGGTPAGHHADTGHQMWSAGAGALGTRPVNHRPT